MSTEIVANNPILNSFEKRISLSRSVRAFLTFCCIAAITRSAYSQVVIPIANDINTVAGNGTAGSTGDGGLATSAELHSPYGVAVDTSGNIYIADQANNKIRKVTATTGD